MLYTLTADHTPTLSEAAQRLGVTEADLDDAFGVVLINPQQHLYTVSVRTGVTVQGDDTIVGPFSEPEIGTFACLGGNRLDLPE